MHVHEPVASGVMSAEECGESHLTEVNLSAIVSERKYRTYIQIQI